MKNYKQILEAVNRGIKFALDDFEDNELIQGQVNSKVSHDHGTKEWLDLMNDVVDLDLPSGTLWCKHNLGVNPNLLSKAKDWYGDYYAWGELESHKPLYDWNNYKFGKYKFGKDYNKLTKYCNNPEYGLNGFTDNLTLLLPEDDAAYQNKHIGNFKFHIPTKEQCEELLKCTNNYWVNNYEPNKLVHNLKDDGGIHGLNGRVFEGKNKNLLFIPAVGCLHSSNITNIGSYCRVWSSSLNLDYPYFAYSLNFYSVNITILNYYRFIGYSIRPIINL